MGACEVANADGLPYGQALDAVVYSGHRTMLVVVHGAAEV
jgi:hypothetical protein